MKDDPNWNETLSRYFAGDLADDERAAVERRIAEDPVARASRDAMAALIGDLQALPEELPVPASAAEPRRPASGRGWAAASVAVGWAALAALWWLWPTPVAEVTVGYGDQELSGALLAHAGPVDVAVDGRARLVVEPGPGVARGGGAEVPVSVASHVAAAAASAVVTVVVLEGTARILPVGGDGSDVVVLEAGSTHHVAPEAGGAHTVTTTRPAPAPIVVDRRDPEALVAQIQRLMDENEALRFEATLLRGQVAQIDGEPMPWPEAASGPTSPGEFRGIVERIAAEHPNFQLVDVDCAEVPCLASFDLGDTDPSAAQEVVSGLESYFGGEEGANLVAMINRSEDDEGTTSTLVLGAIPPGIPADAVGPRIEARARDRLHGP